MWHTVSRVTLWGVGFRHLPTGHRLSYSLQPAVVPHSFVSHMCSGLQGDQNEDTILVNCIFTKPSTGLQKFHGMGKRESGEEY